MLSSKSLPQQKGVVLVIVLVLFMALSGVTLMTIEVSSRGAVEAARVRSEYEAHFMAEEALSLIYKQLSDDRTPYSDSPLDRWFGTWQDEGLSISIVPCNAKVNLNKIVLINDRERVLKIMQLILPGGVDVTRVMGSLGIWTGQNLSLALEKFDRLFYASQMPSYSIKGRKLDTPEEVLLVNGWKEFDRGWVNDTFTVWDEGKLNINFVSRDILLAYFPELGRQVDSVIHWRNTRGFTDLSQVLTVAGIESDSDVYRRMLDYLTVKSTFFEATVVAEVGGCQVVKRYIVSRPNMFETQMPSAVYQNDVSVTFAADD